MPDRAAPGKVRAAGAVLWRPGASGAELALVHRPRYDDWSFPKGKSVPGEHVLVTAVREVSEETGVRAVLGRRLRTIRYLSAGRPKQVEYWAARPTADGAGWGSAPPGFVPNAEVDDLAWLPTGTARGRLSYRHDTQLLDEFTSGPAVTAAVILVRHTTARSRTAWRGEGHPSDLDRPLTVYGQAQARYLAKLLACYGPARVISSAAKRCVATLQPYAALAGARVETEPAFTLAPAADSPVPAEDVLASGAVASGTADGRAPAAAGARERISELVADSRPVVICAHRENLPSLLGWACERLAAQVPHGPDLPKGAFWVLHAGAGRLVSAERHHLGTRLGE